IILFSFVVPLFPTGGWDSPRNWVLPTVALALAPLGIIARFTRASMLEVIRADYTLTARAKGLGEIPVIFKHALKNAFIPVITLLCFVAIFADFLAPLPYTKSNFGRLNEAPSRDYPLGTDQLGRDLLSRMIYGARVSMLVGLGAQVIVVLIGVPIGALSGYLGGRMDIFLTRFIDVMYAFPRLLFVILVMSALGAGLMNIFIAIGLTGWVGIA